MAVPGNRLAGWYHKQRDGLRGEAGKVVAMVLAVALPVGGVMVTLAGPTICLRLALL